MYRYLLTGLFFLSIAPWLPSTARANVLHAPASTDIRISISGGCEFSNAAVQHSVAVIGALNFGHIYHLNTVTDITSAPGAGTIQLRCTPGVTARVTMDAGLHGSSAADRRMQHANNSNYLAYQLYTNPARNIVWDSATGQSLIFNSDTIEALTVFGRLPVQSGILPGTYTDTITVTINW